MQRLGLFFAIAITPELKQQLSWQWRNVFGYDLQSMFPDLEGFSRFNRHSADFVDQSIFSGVMKGSSPLTPYTADYLTPTLTS
jgi:hypothetical protein